MSRVAHLNESLSPLAFEATEVNKTNIMWAAYCRNKPQWQTSYQFTGWNARSTAAQQTPNGNVVSCRVTWPVADCAVDFAEYNIPTGNQSTGCVKLYLVSGHAAFIMFHFSCVKYTSLLWQGPSACNPIEYAHRKLSNHCVDRLLLCEGGGIKGTEI